MPLLIRGGEIVDASQRFVGDVFCEGETITEVAPRIESFPPDTEVIDASGKFVFPGFIEPHAHVYLPVMGTEAKDTFGSASRAALVGGTTTLFDFISPEQQQSPLEAFAEWKQRASGQSACDYAFHLAITRLDDAAEAEIRRIVEEGVTSFKVYLAYPGVGLDDASLYRALRLGKDLGVVTCAHCENEALVSALQAELIAAGKTGPRSHALSRPPQVEADGTHHFLTFAEMAGAEVYLVHVSCADALQVALAARARGVSLFIETLIQFLLLDESLTQRDDFEAAKWLVSPPLRAKAHQEALWDGLADGSIDTLATDHAPFDFKGQKDAGKELFTCIPSGMPGIEDRINLIYTYGVRQGRIDLQRMVELASTHPAQIFGLYPRKGAIEVGADADLVVYDPEYRGEIRAAEQEMNVDYNAFEGWSIEGRPEWVTMRGSVAVRAGKFIGEERGELLRRCSWAR
ncbi:MAG: dihydropyrimidinase [Deltaproteobacteria bacterium]|nr:dihydropyrimidinase [Deltaproteobacteria bacterium]